MTSTVSTKSTSPAWTIFNDQSFCFETLRALGYASYGGADILAVGGDYRQERAMSRLHKVAYDWLDTVVPTPSQIKS